MGVTLLCAPSPFAPEWAMKTLCDGTNIPGSTCELLPWKGFLHLHFIPTYPSVPLAQLLLPGGSKKKTHVLRKCQKCKSGIPLLWPSGGHSLGTTRLIPSCGSFHLLMPSQFGTSPIPPPPLERPVVRDQPVPGDQLEFTRVGPNRWSLERPQVCLVRGQRQSQSVSRGPEVSGVVVEDPGRMRQDRGATGTLPHGLGGAASRCPPRYSGE